MTLIHIFIGMSLGLLWGISFQLKSINKNTENIAMTLDNIDGIALDYKRQKEWEAYCVRFPTWTARKE